MGFLGFAVLCGAGLVVLWVGYADEALAMER